MQLLYRINRTGHDRRRRHARLAHGRPDAPPRHRAAASGRIVRDEAAGLYAQDEQTTDEFGELLRPARSSTGLDRE